jgi:hypothetical protein
MSLNLNWKNIFRSYNVTRSPAAGNCRKILQCRHLLLTHDKRLQDYGGATFLLIPYFLFRNKPLKRADVSKGKEWIEFYSSVGYF